MIGIPVGLLYANAGEWLIHKHLLHGAGRRKKSLWAFHWYEHHREARQNDHVDRFYQRSLWGWHAQSKEAIGLVVAAAAHAPLFPIAPFFTSAVWYSVARYYVVHKRAHQDPEWARENLSWHYDHHMGPNQHANWCVTFPWFDHVMGTREPYVGTEREKRDREKREKIRNRKRAVEFTTSQTEYARNECAISDQKVA
ncbi:MAG: hypothetical protein R3A47_07650 [Polyangiales bacterium]